MKMQDLTEWGKIVKGVNTTPDVGVNQIPIETAKFGNKVDKNGRPPTMSNAVKGKSTNVLFNLGLTEGIKLRLERDKHIDVLHITDTNNNHRIEVRGKKGYESGGYDSKDKLHQVLDRVGKAANISELMNGEVVHINPGHPQGTKAIRTARDVLQTKESKVLFALSLIESIDSKTKNNYNQFVEYCCDFLELEQKPTIRLTDEIFDETFGYFNSEDDSITVSYNRRHQMDVMRTIAHELTHYRQRLDGEELDGSDGSDHENEANAFAGVMLRQWADKHPYLFSEQKFTDYELALMEGGHSPEPKTKKEPGRLFTELNSYAIKTARDVLQTEAFDTDVEWVVDMDRDGIQVFATKVEDAYIELTYKRMTNDDVYIAFSRGGRSSVTGEGGQNKIFGAVINHIQKWVNANKPPRIVFSAFKPNTGAFGSQDTTRSSLYRRMVQRFAGQNGYDYDVEDTGNEDTFILTKQNVEESISGDEMLSTFQRIHHDSGMNPSMDKWVKSQEWGIDTISPNDIVEFEDLFDYDDPFDRIIDVDESQVRRYIAAINAGRKLDPIILGPQHKDGKYSIVDGNHRALAYAALGKDIPVYMPMGKIDENFADGKKKGKSRPGRVKRAGASCSGSVTSLRKKAKVGGEKGRMYHWCANMKSGRKKS